MSNNPNQHIIEAKDLKLGYDGNQLVNSANLAVKQGEMVALIGKNGSGKSTLLKTITGIRKPIQGKITIENRPIDNYTPPEFSRLLAFVGTSVRPPGNLTVQETVAMGRSPYTNWWGSLKKADYDKIRESLGFVSMESFINKRIETLSDGEFQRVMIATALAQDTRIIILDEPTAFLDIPNRMGITELLHHLKGSGKSVIFSTHDFNNVLQHADVLWIIHNKEVLSGAPEDLGLKGIFDTIFEKENIQFELESLQFTKQRNQDREIYLPPETSIEYLWTVKMLERIGFKVLEEQKNSIPLLSMKKRDEKLVWILEKDNTLFNFDSLYGVADHLTLKY